MERVTISALLREEGGKHVARSLRRDGLIPAVMYREGRSQSIKVPRKELVKLLNTMSGEQVMLNLKFDDGIEKIVLLKDYQIDPVKGELLHSDFFEVSLTEEVRVTVHVTTKGEPVGVKRDGGILQSVLREVEIECLPEKMPGEVIVDISSLEVGQSLHVSDLKFEDGIKVITDGTDMICAVITPVSEEKEVPEAEAELGTSEPEVVKKGKKEEGTEVEEKKEK